MLVFAAAGLAVAIGGVFMAGLADQLADRTGLGEAIVGGALLGATTSLSGTVTSVSAAALDHPDLAVSNAIGGIAVQTAFLAVADITYRRANLEHAAISSSNLAQATLLVILLSLPVLAIALPPMTALGVHPVSILLAAVYVFGLRLTARIRQEPMWIAKKTPFTRQDRPDPRASEGDGTALLSAKFIMVAAIVGTSGWLIAVSGLELAARTGIEETVLGALMTATITSLPELVTTLAAVRRNALQLAVGGIIGGNAFDVLFLVLSDMAYRPGSIYHAAGEQFLFWLATGIVMSAVLLLGLVARVQYGVARIGFESAAILVIYASAVLLTVYVI